jgi:hypothetical protein
MIGGIRVTCDEALARIASIEADPAFQPGRGSADDARKLVGMLPERALHVMAEGWIRRHGDDPAVIEFFWSNSFKMHNPGQRITAIRTLGDGTFGVELRTSSVRFDATKWQRADDGEPRVGLLSLNVEGGQKLVDEVFDWQLGSSK